MTTRIFVISMPESADRRRQFAERAKDAAVNWQFFDACTALTPELIYDEAEAELRWGRKLTPAELGVYASHYSLWRQLADDTADQYLLFEDDVIVDWKLIERLLEIDFHKSGIDLLRLHCLHPPEMRMLKYHYVGTKNLVELRGPSYGAQGYVISRAAARQLANVCRRVSRPIDSQLDRSWDHGIANLCLFPFPIIEESGVSTIGSRRGRRSQRRFGVRVSGKLLYGLERLKRRVWLLTRSLRVSEPPRVFDSAASRSMDEWDR